MIRILSVPHTGTRFVVEMLQNAGYRKTHSFWGDGDFIQVHFDGKYNQPIVYRENGIVIIPLREKDEVIESWKRRQRNLGELEQYWQEMCDYIQDHDDVHLLHVDDPNRRDDELQAIVERIGSPLIADFSVKVGHGA